MVRCDQPCTIRIGSSSLSPEPPAGAVSASGTVVETSVESAHPGWRFPVEVSIGSVMQVGEVVLGLESGATDSLDSRWVSGELPPWSPSDVFEVRCDVLGTNGLTSDLREDAPGTREWMHSQAPEGSLPGHAAVGSASDPTGVNHDTDRQSGRAGHSAPGHAWPERDRWSRARLRDRHSDNTGIISDMVSGALDTVTPTHCALSANTPNPFDATVIRFDLPKAADCEIGVFDVSGRQVRTLTNGPGGYSGVHTITWDGRDEKGVKVASGVYFYQMKTPDYQATRTLHIVR